MGYKKFVELSIDGQYGYLAAVMDCIQALGDHMYDKDIWERIVGVHPLMTNSSQKKPLTKKEMEFFTNLLHTTDWGKQLIYNKPKSTEKTK